MKINNKTFLTCTHEYKNEILYPNHKQVCRFCNKVRYLKNNPNSFNQWDKWKLED